MKARVFVAAGSIPALALSMACSPVAQAQTAAAADRPDQPLEQIVVTASKRQETVLKAPVAVSLVSPERLQSAGVLAVKDLNTIAPNTQIRTAGVFGATKISMRGISNADIFEMASPTVATYVDGVYVARTEGMNGLLQDLERIEVLRGPQGTLYGRNSTGGNLNILTASPTQQFDAAADLALGNYSDVQARAMVNVPITDTLAVRGAFTFHRNDGYYDTRNTTARNYGVADEQAGRVTLLWTPSDTFSWRLAVENYQNNGTPDMDIPTGPDGRPSDGLPVFSRPVTNEQEAFFDIDNLMVRSRMDWQVSDAISLNYVAGYQQTDFESLSIQGTLQTHVANHRFTPTTASSHEINLSFDNGLLQNLAGVSYFDQRYKGFGNADLFFADILFFTHGILDTSAWGVFDQATLHLAPNFRLIGGVRYTREKVHVFDDRQTLCPLSSYPPSEYPLSTVLWQELDLPGCATNPGVVEPGRRTDSKVTWKGGLQYDLSDRASSYLTVSTGFKSGGLNLGGAVTPENAFYTPETVTNYEAGIKARFLDERLAVNAAFFYTRYTDIQIQQIRFDPAANSVISLVTNAGKATNYGVEIESQWSITDNDRLSGFFNYLNATYDTYEDAFDALTNTPVASLRGNDLPYAPEYSTSLQYAHDFNLENGAKIVSSASFYWQAESYIREFNFPIDKIGSYSRADASLTYVSPSSQWKWEAYVRNLSDEVIRNGGYPLVGLYLSNYDAPRTYGLRVSYEL